MSHDGVEALKHTRPDSPQSYTRVRLQGYPPFGVTTTEFAVLLHQTRFSELAILCEVNLILTIHLVASAGVTGRRSGAVFSPMLARTACLWGLVASKAWGWDACGSHSAFA